MACEYDPPDWKTRDRSGRTRQERCLAEAAGQDAQAHRAERRGDSVKAQSHRDNATEARRKAKGYHPL